MLLYMVTSCINGSLVIVVYYIPVYFQFAQKDNGIESAVTVGFSRSSLRSWLLLSSMDL